MPLIKRTMWAVFLALALLLCTAATAWAADAATLTITPEKTETAADGSTKITYSITVTPPEGKAIGVFSFRLKPSGQMTLPQKFKVDGQEVITYADSGLAYDGNTGKGVFHTYEYTPKSNFFAAVGSTEDNRMTDEAEIMTIVATVPAGVSGAFILDADFTVAPDGSGNSYTAVVDTQPVTVGSSDTGSSGGTGGTPQGAGTGSSGGSSGSGTNIAVAGLDRPTAGEAPDTEVIVAAPGEPKVTTTWEEDGAAMDGAASFRPGHVYTVTIRVVTNGAAFDTSVYTNAGYTLERVSDTELLLHRSFYVEQNYTKDLTTEEAEKQVEAITAPPAEEDAGDSAGDAQTTDQAPQEGTAERSSGSGVLIAAAVLAAAAVAVQFAVPGGWKRVFKKTDNTKAEGEGKQ